VAGSRPDELRCENKSMHQRLHLRLKALEKRLPDETKPHKALLPEWLTEDLRQQRTRHVVIVKRESTGSPYSEWCHFEERQGPAPLGSVDDARRVYLTEDDMAL
jgi:hypothetical protein